MQDGKSKGSLNGEQMGLKQWQWWGVLTVITWVLRGKCGETEMEINHILAPISVLCIAFLKQVLE